MVSYNPYLVRGFSRTDIWALGVTICCFIFLVFFNVQAHKIVAVDTVEQDSYFYYADNILHGIAYTDPFHPPLYVLFTAGLSYFIGGNTFLAGGIISSLATSLFIGLTYLLAKFFLNPIQALLVQCLVSLDEVVIEHGIWVSTDALYAVISIAILVMLVMRLQRRIRQDAIFSVGIGVLFGFALLTRYIALPILLVIVYCIYQEKSLFKYKLRLSILVILITIVVTLPWFYYNNKINGSPFANENWRNFAFAVYGKAGDWRYFDVASQQVSGYIDTIVHYPINTLRLWGQNTLDIIKGIFLIHSSVLSVFLPIGFYTFIRDRLGRLLLLYLGFGIGSILLTFFYMPRFMLPVTPVLVIMAVKGFLETNKRFSSVKFFRKVFQPLMIALSILIPLFFLPLEVFGYIQSQPIAEVDLFNKLVADATEKRSVPIVIATSYPYLGYFSMHPEQGQVYSTPLAVKDFYFSKQFPESLMKLTETNKAEYILVSDRTTHGAVRAGVLDSYLSSCWILEQEAIQSGNTIHLYKRICPW